MAQQKTSDPQTVARSAFSSGDVATILQGRGWLAVEASAEQRKWCERAAALLGGQVEDRVGLADLLGLVFRYDASKVLEQVESHVVLSRYGARDVVRKIALLLLEDAALTPDRFSEMVNVLKTELEIRGRELFHPLRLALAGRAGEGELDRVILLLDEAAGLEFAARVKGARERILEFCAALD